MKLFLSALAAENSSRVSSRSRSGRLEGVVHYFWCLGGAVNVISEVPWNKLIMIKSFLFTQHNASLNETNDNNQFNNREF
jgi:hypothetical protein